MDGIERGERDAGPVGVVRVGQLLRGAHEQKRRRDTFAKSFTARQSRLEKIRARHGHCCRAGDGFRVPDKVQGRDLVPRGQGEPRDVLRQLQAHTAADVEGGSLQVRRYISLELGDRGRS